MKILIVDDEPAVREILGQILGSRGYDIEEAGNGEEALDLFQTNHYDLILSDVDMPIIDGLTLQKKLNSVPFVIMSANPAYGLETDADTPFVLKGNARHIADVVTRRIEAL